MMTQEEVLELFKKEAATLGTIESSQSDIILKLAQVLADTSDQIAQAAFERMIYVGAVMYQEALGEFRARAEMADMMQTSRSATK